MEKNPTNNTIRFSDEEIKEIRNLQNLYQQKILKFGELNIERLSIENAIKELKQAEESAKLEYLDLQKREKSMMDSLISKYGEGSIDLKDGTFTPQKS